MIFSFSLVDEVDEEDGSGFSWDPDGSRDEVAWGDFSLRVCAEAVLRLGMILAFPTADGKGRPLLMVAPS